MSFAPRYQPAGALNFDTAAEYAQPLHSNVFRPPPSPSASSYNLAKSTGSLFSDISMSNAHSTGTAKRKRTGTRESTPLDWQVNMDGAHDGREVERSREWRYTLAGQICTPAAAPPGAENGMLEDSVYSDIDYRRALGPNTAPDSDYPSAQAPDRGAAQGPSLAAWSLFSLQTIGSVVGKVWEFCKEGLAFRGFHAGGGQGYNVNGSTVTETTGNPWGLESDMANGHVPEQSPMDREVPAYFPQQAQTPYSPAYYDVSTPDSTPRPAAKRRQVSANNNDELRNWVVVDEPNNQPPPRRFAAEVKAATADRVGPSPRSRPGYYSQTAASSHRRISAPAQRFTGGAAALTRGTARPSLHIPHAASPSTVLREPASFASPRGSPVTRATPSRIPVPVQPSAQYSHSPNPFSIPGTSTSATTTTSSSTSAFKPSSSASRPSSRHSLSANTLRPPPSPTKHSSAAARHHHRRNQSTASSSSTTTAAASAISKSRRHSTRRPMSPSTTSNGNTTSITSVSNANGDADAALRGTTTSPLRLDAEARQLAQRKLAAERDAEDKVDAFNARLLSMIRQGREALGTRVEVLDGDGDLMDGEGEGDMVGDGWEDGDGVEFGG